MKIRAEMIKLKLFYIDNYSSSSSSLFSFSNSGFGVRESAAIKKIIKKTAGAAIREKIKY